MVTIVSSRSVHDNCATGRVLYSSNVRVDTATNCDFKVHLCVNQHLLVILIRGELSVLVTLSSHPRGTSGGAGLPPRQPTGADESPLTPTER